MNYSLSDAQKRNTEPIRHYNPQSMADYYRFRPWLGLFRSLKIILYFGIFITQLILDKWFNQEEKNKQKRAEKLRKILTKLGPTFIKVGQALSTRPDLIRKDFLEELIKLQDQLPPFDNDTALAIIERELDLEINQAYKEFSAYPIAAASLGQVYKAVLHTGEEVAVKVQRPNLLPVISLDLYLMRLASRWVAHFYL